MNETEYRVGIQPFVKYKPWDATQYLISGLTAEAGELLGVYAKETRKHGGDAANSPWSRGTYHEDLCDELGDVLWFATMLADHLGVSLDTLRASNYNKLAARNAQGKIVDHE